MVSLVRNDMINLCLINGWKKHKIKVKKTAKERKKCRRLLKNSSLRSLDCHSCYLVLSRNNKAKQSMLRDMTNERLRIVTLAMHSPQKETDLASPMRRLWRQLVRPSQNQSKISFSDWTAEKPAGFYNNPSQQRYCNDSGHLSKE